ncbi:MAG: L7Ae/L30e/S12e/Gadd45 family ribosomal protein [Oscillospiraceae bacterium]
MPKELKTGRRVTGLKQTVRAVRSGEAQRVFFARDADEALLAPLRALCRERGVPALDGGSMKELGEACGLAVGAAAAAELG